MRNPIWHFSKLIWVLVAAPIVLFCAEQEEVLGLRWDDLSDRRWIVGGAVVIGVLVWALLVRLIETSKS